MNERQRPWRLPDGVKFYIYPKYLMIVEGVEVKLTPMQAKIILFLMANPGRRWSMQEIASAVYSDQENGGALDFTCIAVHMVNILKKFRNAGVELCLKAPGLKFGYTFVSIGLDTKKRSDAVRFATLPASDPRLPLRPKSMEGHPYIDVFDGTDGWTFPLRIERRDGQLLVSNKIRDDKETWSFPERVERRRAK